MRDAVESLAAAPPRIEVKHEIVADPGMAERLKRYEARFGDIDGEVMERITNHTEVDGAAAHFADDVQTLLMEFVFTLKLSKSQQ
ncbi:hypothetical protein ABEW34_01390 [Paenibacillus algorifonticola]|uniref:hypothetical protein n=1 Tax=Paenibacillus algorifonticola TaxID=684063 RepID=UPI003D2C524F